MFEFCEPTILSVHLDNKSIERGLKPILDSINEISFSRIGVTMDMKILEQQLYIHCKPMRDWILCKVMSRECLIEESDICLVMATGDKTYKNADGYLVEVNVTKGDRVLVPRKIRRITADITTDYFLCSMFDILSFWK